MFFIALLLRFSLSETNEEHAKIPISELLKRRNIEHPCALYNKKDYELARHNAKLNPKAQLRMQFMIDIATRRMKIFNNDKFIDSMVPRTTPGTGSFCPNCQAHKLPWHVNGNWEWKVEDPDHIKCRTCGMTFPNEQYPEVHQFRSQWDKEQVISYVDNPSEKCMNYNGCKSSISGVIRGRKLNYFLNAMYDIAWGYSFNNKPEYARAVKKGLLKLAERVPKYLVYAGYAYVEYCDEDPHVAVKDPSKCKNLITAPGIPKREGLYHGFGAASRLGTSGMDGMYTYLMAIAYDLTADAKDENGNNLYTEEEKKLICENCLIEAALLGFYCTSIDNKGVGNRKGVAFTGLATGSTILTRYGLNGFVDTINGWYLPDGGSPESAHYVKMTFDGIYELGIAFRNYSDPEDFVPPPGERKYHNFNANTDTVYDQAWHNLLWTSYGNYLYPSIGDSFNTTSLSNLYVDYLYSVFNTTTVKTYVQEKYDKIDVPKTEGIFLRDLTKPAPEVETNITFVFPDIVFPYLSQGFIRNGYQGRDSLAVLDASNYGVHHHFDSLNLVYWKHGRELLNDLGYLWDHKDLLKTLHTNIHNTVVIDGRDQIRDGRNGSFHTFYSKGDAKYMMASSDAYNEASIYSRAVTQINHRSSNKSYLVDIFRANGGSRREYVFHGVHHTYTMNQKLNFVHSRETKVHRGCVKFHIYGKGYFDIANVVLKPIYSDGTMGENMAEPPIDNIFHNVGLGKCPAKGDWCFYIGNLGKHSLTTGHNGPNGESSIHFEASAPDKNGIYNIALNLGNTNGYTGENALLFDNDKEYYLEFDIKGTFFPRITIQYWGVGGEKNASTRMYSDRMTEISKVSISSEKWNKFKGKLRLEQVSKVLGADFDDELQIKWDIDDNYTFTSFTPKRVVKGVAQKQRVFFEEGWGQRDYRNTDIGVTLPYFYFSREGKNELSTFVNVYEGAFRGEEIVKSVSINEMDNGSVAIMIDTTEGKDYVLSSFDGKEVSGFGLKTNAEIAVQIEEDVKDIGNQRSTPMMINGDYFVTPNINLKGRKSFTKGEFYGTGTGRTSKFVVKSDEINLEKDNFEGLSFEVKGECDSESDIERAYPIRKVEKAAENEYHFYTRTDGEGFRTHCHKSWRIPYVAIAPPATPTPDPTPEPTTSQLEESNKGTTNAVVIGASVSAAVIVIIVVAVVVFVIFRRRSNEDEMDIKATVLV